MRILPFSGVCFSVALLFAVNFCHGNGSKTVEVFGRAECADCALSNIKPGEAFSGLPVTIDCKLENGNGWSTARGIGGLYVKGKFKVPLLEEIVEDGMLKEECYGLLWSASGAPCLAFGGLESSPPICADDYYYARPPPPRPPVPTPPVRNCIRLCPGSCCRR